MSDPDLSCPLPFSRYDRVVLAHGGGGRVMQRLIRELFVARFDNPALARGHDGALLDPGGRLVMTTDAFTVRPLFFPGGDIGSLAVHGTVNDLAVSGAHPRHLAVSFLLEEGLPLATLERVVDSMAAAARACGASIVTGDTKVVERGKGDGIYVTTTGIGALVCETPPGPERVRPGDAVLVSGPIGDHGVAVMGARDGAPFETSVRSDSAPIHREVAALYEAGLDVHCLRDATRGGLGAVLAEIAREAGVAIRADHAAVPVRPEVEDACELLGLDPWFVACEGRFVAFVAGADAGRALALLGSGARIGAVTTGPPEVTVTSPLGTERILDLPSGEQLPRIC